MTSKHCFLFCFLFLAPLQILSVCGSPWFSQPPKPIGDGIDYEAIGYSVSKGDGWSTHFSDPIWKSSYLQADSFQYGFLVAKPGPIVPDTNRPPLLPTWIAAVYQILPRGPVAFAVVRISLALALAAGCSLFACWGFQLVSNSPSEPLRQLTPWLAPGLVAIAYSERNLRNYLTDFLTEPFAFLLTAAFLLILWDACRRPSLVRIAIVGASFSFLIYCRSSFLLWLPFLAITIPFFLAWSAPSFPRRWSHAIRYTAFFLVIVFVVQSPWWIRNSLVLGRFQPLGTKGSTTLLGGYCDESVASRGEWQFAPERRLRALIPPPVESNHASDWIANELAIAAQAAEEVRGWTTENMSILPGLMVQRVVTEWNPYTGKALLLKIFALLGAIGLVFRDRRTLAWLAVPLLMQTIVTALTYSVGGRFLVPVYGCVYLLAVIGMAELARLSQQAIRSFASARSRPTGRYTAGVGTARINISRIDTAGIDIAGIDIPGTAPT
ncbi:hypothetical protein VN12_12460 [Pirellula sp. SH-Sr6A]|uniref:hypothetical protein n=1 Tax=Pirellula sp. SH-Sr6A TaxID=1632865 RepID=UPI00078E5B98|nr:hypothetical protein [Pirellula sp. SH-Sr6A]AMV32932.1 hypothetical protein VN12_12460 [Pirellula sp. SH-Sr6A]